MWILNIKVFFSIMWFRKFEETPIKNEKHAIVFNQWISTKFNQEYFFQKTD